MMTHEEYKRLINDLNKYIDYYYNKSESLISDEEYDILYRKLIDYEATINEVASNSPSLKVGNILTHNREVIKHLTKMYSMDNIFNKEEVDSWVKRHRSVFWCEPKYDGVSLNIIYKDGKLFKGILRGDGLQGETVTNHVKTITDIPHTIPYMDTIEIRGEIVMSHRVFKELNIQRIHDGKQPYKNTRNTVSGAMSSIDSQDVANKKLSFRPWGIGKNELNHKTLEDDIEWLRYIGFITMADGKLCKNEKEIVEYINDINKNRSSFTVDLDGVVIKVNNKDIHDEIGYTRRVPKWLVAYKLPSVEKETTILGIIQQVGKLGDITPVAIIEPIEIGGVTITRVTLHNYDHIRKLDLMVNDKVIVIRSGDVIPKLIKVLKDKRDGTQQYIDTPKTCINCGSKLDVTNVIIRCTNNVCSSRVTKTIYNFVTKKHMDIKGLGYETIKTLHEKGILNSIIDLYKLTKDKLQDIDGFKDKSINNLLNSIQTSKGKELNKVIASLSIPLIGNTASKLIVDKYKGNAINVTTTDLQYIDGIGQEMSISYINYMENNKAFIKELLDIIKPSMPDEVTTIENDIFTNKKVTITGKLDMKRSTLEDIIIVYGGTISKSVSKNTDILIYGDKAGSKLDKAKKLGIECVDAKQLTELFKDVETSRF